MRSTDARPGDAGTSTHSPGIVRSGVAATSQWITALPTRRLLVFFVAAQWFLVAVTATRIGHDGSLALVIAQVIVLLPLALALVHGIASRLGDRLFAAWATALWIALPYAGYLYATPSLRHDYAERFLRHVLGLADDPRFAAMVAFAAAMFFTLRTIETSLTTDLAIALAAAGIGAALAPRTALVGLAPAVGLAVAGRWRHAIVAAAALSILLAGVEIAVAAGPLAGPFAHLGLHAPGDVLASLRENFWSGRVLEWLAIAGVAGAIRGSRATGLMIGVALLAALLSVPSARMPLDRNLALLQAFLPAWPAVALAVASIPLLVPRAKP